MLELTDAAINQAISKTENDGNDTIRIGVTGGGCTGFKYIFAFAETIHSTDHILDYGKFQIVIDEESLPLLDEATLDFVHEGINQSFKIINPKETASCGCGVSISF
tara:strand:- start:109 stop:426 length:318 start_codon:yes stop_codon:yes gene_type:complete